MFFPYEYFSGANVVLELEGIPVEEAAGLTFSINESKIPLYGYSSRHFDAVGRGKVLVRGSMVVNFVHKNYLYALTEVSAGSKTSVDGFPEIDLSDGQAAQQLESFLNNPEQRDALAQQIYDNPAAGVNYIAAFQNKFWKEKRKEVGLLENYVNPDLLNMHDIHKDLKIKVSFGERRIENSYNGVTGLLLSGVHFVGSGIPIQIDESVIVEEYQFFARNVHGIKDINKSSLIKADYDLNNTNKERIQISGNN